MSAGNFDDAYDAVVIGAGNGGLVAVATLAQKGQRVILFEQHNLPGGFATSFTRGRFEFEPSLHEIADFGPAENKGNVRVLLEDKIGIDAQWVRVPEAYRLIIPDDVGGLIDVVMPFGEKEFIEQAEEYVPGSRPSVTKFMRLCEEVIGAFSYIGRSKGNPERQVLTSKYANFLKTASYTLKEVLDALKMPYRAQKIITAYWCYLGPGVSTVSFSLFAAMFNRYITKGAYIPRLRSHGYTAALEMKIRQFGAQVQYNTRVDKILVDQGRVSGVQTAQGDKIKTGCVIANTSPHTVYSKLIYPKDQVPPEAYQNLNARKLGFSGFVAYLGLDKSAPALGINEYSYFIYSDPDTDRIYDAFHRLQRPLGQATVCLNNAISDASPEGTSILYLTTLFDGDCWQDVQPADYFNLKNKIAEEMIEEFEKAVGVKIKEHIEEIEIATPATFARYTGAYNGGIYGYEPAPWDSIVPRLMSMKAEKYIKGLEFAGGFASRCHGYSSTLQSGETAALLSLRDLAEVRLK